MEGVRTLMEFKMKAFGRRSQFCLVGVCSLLTLAIAGSTRARSSEFYVIGSAPGSHDGKQLYEIDAATLRVVRSVEIDNAQSGMITSTRDAVILSDNDSTLWRISAPDLKVLARFSPGPDPDGGDWCLEHIFVHPISGLAYFSCETGHGGVNTLVVDPVKKKIVSVKLPWTSVTTSFFYDPKHQLLYLTGSEPAIVNLQNELIAYIKGGELAKDAGMRPGSYLISSLALLPNGNLVLRSQNDGPILFLYDALNRKVLRTWSLAENSGEKQESTRRGARKSIGRGFGIDNGPVASLDGSRLFAASKGHVLIWNANTLEQLNSRDLPESPASNGDECFYLAPDGHGMWYVGESGKVYRLDDHTGDLIEEVKLPFHLISLIREL